MGDPAEEGIGLKCDELFGLCEELPKGLRLDRLCDNLRLLRNACAKGSTYQNFIANHVNGLNCVKHTLEHSSLRPASEEVNACRRLALQVMGNLIVNNNDTKGLVWTKCCEVLSVALNAEDEKTASYAAMVIYNILLGLSTEELSGQVYCSISLGLVTLARNGSEYGLFAVENLLTRDGWLIEFYPKLDKQLKYFLLDVMCENLSSLSACHSKEENRLHPSAIQFISNEFCAHSDLLLDTRSYSSCKDGDGIENTEDNIEDPSAGIDPFEITKMLEVLASAAGNELYLSVLQSNGPLLVQNIFLLKSLHLMGKLAVDKGDLQHPFASIQRLSSVDSSSINDEVELHPAYGFKRNLIRLLGNLAWKNKEIQDKILELECIPLILDCCNIDERNPFITQWAIMAIRNLCEGNLEVQKVIAGLKREGVVDCNLLNEMGLTLHDSGNPGEKISIVPLPRKN